MSRFSVSEKDNYGGQGGNGFFSLKDDKDIATVRFMYNTIDDVMGDSVHEVELDGKKRYVNCLREYSDPVDSCPLCAAKMRVLAKFFIMLYDEDSQEVKIWDRGRTFGTKMASLCARYDPLVSTPFELERNGKRGDMKTTYETYALDTDDVTLEDLPEMPEILGGLVLDKSYDELVFFLDNGYFEGDIDEQTPPQRNAARDRRPQGAQQQRQTRQPAARQAKPAARQAEPEAPAPASRTRRRPATNTDDVPF